MPVVMIGNFGRDKEGIYTYRINATSSDDLHKIIDECRKIGWKFWDTPNIQKVHKTWSVLLKIYNPEEMNYPEDESQ
jgi:hypothetical protein